MTLNPEMEKRLQDAIRYFWGTRDTQAQKQGAASGSEDAGARSAVTGGAQYMELPGWYRPEPAHGCRR
jgi:hypothetical protein